MSSQSTDGGPRRRTPGYLNLVATIGVLLVVIPLALRASSTPPPAVAEFAPQAQRQIRDAPSEQTSQFGRGAGGAPGEGGLSPIPTPSALQALLPSASPAIERGKVRNCIGDPERQIEDPQSPPCVPYWTGNNGGSTAPGVTASEIRIRVVLGTDNVEALRLFFNKRFQFYGRKINVIYGCGSPNNPTPDQLKADADCTADTMNAFAVTDYGQNGGIDFYQELARRHIISASREPTFDNGYMQVNRPYLWQYTAATDEIFASMGRWACAKLAYRNATHTTDPTIRTKQRVFGIVRQRVLADEPTTEDALVRELDRCHIKPAVVVTNCSNCDNAQDPTRAQNAIQQLIAAHVTTVLCLCVAFDNGNLLHVATNSAYFPEWAITSYMWNDSMFYTTLNCGSCADQLQNAFGLRFLPKALPWADNPDGWASQEGDRTHSPPATTQFAYYENSAYRSLLLLASGLQMAGPHLDPTTFETGLQNAVFPNPQTPIFAGNAGFQTPLGGDHSMTKDSAEIWWSNAAPTGGGAWCYVDGGIRHDIFAPWDRTDKIQQGPCDAGGASE